MPAAHRETDLRVCDAQTIVVGQSTVFVNGLLWAVNQDPCDHGDGDLITGIASTVTINGKGVIVVGDTAEPDDLCIPIGPPHCDPDPITGSGDVVAG